MNATFVCFGCRLTRRDGRHCRKCRQVMVSIGGSRCIPRRADDRGWSSLQRYMEDMYSWRGGRWLR